MKLRVSSAFIPVSDPEKAAPWYARHLDLRVETATPFSATLSTGGETILTLMGPASGIAATPGLAWASCGFATEDVHATRERLAGQGIETGEITGDPNVCLFFVAKDPDGNTLLFTDR